MTAPLDLVTRDNKVVWHPFTQHQTSGPPLPVVAAQGALLHLADGNTLVDAISSWWTCLHGHSHPDIVSAVAAQVAQLDHVIYAGCTHEPAVTVAEQLLELTGMDGGRVFFSDNGSTAVEVALKACVQYWQNVGQPERTEFVTLTDAYHGDTVGAMSAGDPGDFGRPFKRLLFPTHRVQLPTVHDGEDDAERMLATLHQTLSELGERFAGLVIEPMVQGAGGMKMTRSTVLESVIAATQAHGGWLIADEVMTGFGRTGELFAWQHQRHRPDVLCVAKGLTGGTLPLSATVFRPGIFEAFLGPDKQTALLHGHSFTANPIACAAAKASLAVVRAPDFARRLGRLREMTEALLGTMASHPAVARTRQLGTIGVVELAGGQGYFAGQGLDLGAIARRHGVLLRPLGAVLYTMPPLAITAQQMRQTYDAVQACADAWERHHATG